MDFGFSHFWHRS